ncbi:MAG TPA: immunoglobulin domain-containing protein, partial [Candidatus Dormibacteraeota bacterium]|nr:immunoglobulin domain-containing protein [Candidatus Dormibacteraeota bacterium]
VSGAGSSKLTIANLTNTDGASYDVRIVGSLTITSAPAILTVVTATPPVIVGQPSSRIDYLGTPVTFSVSATNAYPMTFQWRRNGTNLLDGPRVGGVFSSNLTITALSSSDAGSYSVIVSNVGGATISSDAAQTILDPGDTSRWRPMWSCAPGINPWATATGGPNTPNERTLAYNTASNQLYVVQRNGSRVTIYVLNATNGAFLYNLNTNGYSYTGNIPLCGIAVADDGAIYACNNDTAGTGIPTLKVYRWANSDPGTTPQLVYSGDPLGGVNARWGDALDARSSGFNTVLLTDDHQPNTTNPSLAPYIFVLQPNGSMSSFAGKVYLLDQTTNPAFISSIGHTLQFDPSGTAFWFKHYGQALAKNSYNPSNPNGSPATFLASYNGFPATAGPATQLFSKKLLAVLDFTGVAGSSPDQVELYDFSNPSSPVLVASNQFPANAVANVNRIGQIIMTTNYVFAIDANNGLLAMQLVTPPLLLTNAAIVNNHFQFDVLGEPNTTAIIQASSNLVNWLPLATNTLSPFHFSDPATPRPALRYYRAFLPGQ